MSTAKKAVVNQAGSLQAFSFYFSFDCGSLVLEQIMLKMCQHCGFSLGCPWRCGDFLLVQKGPVVSS